MLSSRRRISRSAICRAVSSRMGKAWGFERLASGEDCCAKRRPCSWALAAASFKRSNSWRAASTSCSSCARTAFGEPYQKPGMKTSAAGSRYRRVSLLSRSSRSTARSRALCASATGSRTLGDEGAKRLAAPLIIPSTT